MNVGIVLGHFRPLWTMILTEIRHVCDAFLANWSAMLSRRAASSRGSTPTPRDQLKKSRTESAGAVQVASATPLAGGANARTRAAFRLVSSPFQIGTLLWKQ
jgi:hypothetical protein